jgi:hypothetical protein
MDPNIGKATGKERTVAPCKESLPTSRGPHTKSFLEVQGEIWAHMTSDRQTLLTQTNTSAKRNLMSVGVCTDTFVDVDTSGNADGKRQCLDNGQTVIRNGLPPSLVDDPDHSFGSPLSQLLACVKQPCAWARELFLEREHYLTSSPNIHEENYSGDRQETR